MLEYVMCEKSELVEVASAVRTITGAPTSFHLKDLKHVAIESRLGVVPDYVKTEAERVANIVKSYQNENTITFITMADLHLSTRDAQRVSSATHAFQAAQIIKSLIPIDFTAVLGDTVSGSAYDNKVNHIADLIGVMRTMMIVNPEVNLVGNHDPNVYHNDYHIDASELFEYMGRFNQGNKPSVDEDRGCFYFDLEDRKLRVICLNTTDLKTETVVQDTFISVEQANWLISTLDMTGKSGWGIIVLSHYPIHWSMPMTKVLTILEKYNTGEYGYVTINDTKIEFSFNGKNAAKLIGTFHGHTHNYIYGETDSGIVRFGTPNVCYDMNNEYGNGSYSENMQTNFGDEITYEKTGDKDTAFTVNIIDLSEQTIRSVAYGAGPADDRVLSYADA